jgi:GT2 family glycosyltransferase
VGVHEYHGATMASLPAFARPGAGPRPVSALTGCAMLLRATVVRELGGFREDFFAYVEDTELGLRWSRAGWRLLHVPSALVLHKVPLPEPAPGATQIALRDRNRRRLARSHFTGGQRAAFYAWFYTTRALRIAGFVLRGDLARARAIVRGIVAP